MYNIQMYMYTCTYIPVYVHYTCCICIYEFSSPSFPSPLHSSLLPRQIFFHYSELASGAESEMVLGACVEFVVQNRQVRFSF